MPKDYKIRAEECDEYEFVEIVLVCNGFDLERTPQFPREAPPSLIAEHVMMWVESYDIPDTLIGDLAADLTNGLADPVPPEHHKPS